MFWKSPNDFRIDLDQPFKYVYGVDILDISVPRTMYSVDTYNNELYIRCGHMLNDDVYDINEIEFQFIKRDYTVKELIEEMSIEGSPFFSNSIAVGIEDNVSIDERKSVIVYTNVDTPPKPFLFDMKKSTMNDTLGFDEVARPDFPQKYRKIYHDDNDYLFASVPIFQSKIEITTGFTLDNQIFELDMTSDDNNIVSDDINGGDIYTHLNSTDYKYQSYHIKGMTLSNLQTNKNSVDFFVYKLELSSDVDTKSDMKQALSDWILSGKISEKPQNITLVAKNTFQQVGSNLEFTLNENSRDPYYFKNIPITVRGNIFYMVYIDSVNLANHEKNTFNSTLQIEIIDGFQLTSPGLVQLSGERYITVHCDEIENHLRGSMMYNTYSPGLAMINMGVQGFSENRIDFFGVKYKEFHPIGKLTGMRFSLKTPKGLLYDLKNVNWHMLLSIKYYVPKKTTIFEHSLLNPNYNYNYIQYQIDKAQNEIGYDNNDEIDEDDFNDHFIKKEIALKEAYYDDSEGSYDSSSSEEENI